MSTLAERITQRMTELSLTQAELARQAKVKPPSVAQWRNGRTKTLSGDVLLRTAIVLRCLPSWLATGVGPVQGNPYKPSEPVSAAEPGATSNIVNAAERRAFRWPFRRLSREKIDALSEVEVAELEGAWRAAAGQLGIDVESSPDSGKRKRG